MGSPDLSDLVHVHLFAFASFVVLALVGYRSQKPSLVAFFGVLLFAWEASLRDWSFRNVRAGASDSLNAFGLYLVLWTVFVASFPRPGAWLWYLLSALAVVNVLQLPYHYVYVCRGPDCLRTMLADQFGSIPAFGWTSDIIGLYVLIGTLIAIETPRREVPFVVGGYRGALPWLLALVLLGFDVVLPLFLWRLLQSELTTPVGSAASAGSYWWLYAAEWCSFCLIHFASQLEWLRTETSYTGYMELSLATVASRRNAVGVMLAYASSTIYMLQTLPGSGADFGIVRRGSAASRSPLFRRLTSPALSSSDETPAAGRPGLSPSPSSPDVSRRRPSSAMPAHLRASRGSMERSMTYPMSRTPLESLLPKPASPIKPTTTFFEDTIAWALRFLVTVSSYFGVAAPFAMYFAFREQTVAKAFKPALPPYHVVSFVHDAASLFLLTSSFCYALSPMVEMHFAFVFFCLLFFVFVVGRWGFRRLELNRQLADWILAWRVNALLTWSTIVFTALNLLMIWGQSMFATLDLKYLTASYEENGTFTLLRTVNVCGVVFSLFDISQKVTPRRSHWRYVALLSLIFLLIGHHVEQSPCRLELGKEYIDASQLDVALEKDYTDIISGLVHHLKKTDRSHVAERLQHGKAHGLVRAEFVVEGSVGYQYQHGIFQTGKSYPAYLRFSNSGSSKRLDADPQARGLAIKLMGVPGPKVLQGDNEEKFTQDFLLVSSDRFFMADPVPYPQLLRLLGDASLSQVIDWVCPTWNPFTWRLSTVYLLFRIAFEGLPMLNPLDWQYYSTTAYRLGPENQAVKYSMRPCTNFASRATVAARRADDERRRLFHPEGYLQDSMRDYLDKSDACFEFLIQVQTDACKMPIEDPTRSWLGPWIKMASVHIPSQQFARGDQLQFGEALSFNPWHTLPEHRPLGAINLARKPSYASGQATRNAINGRPFVEPTGNEVFTAPVLPDPLFGAGNTRDYQYATYAPPFDGLPKHVKTLPQHEQFDLVTYGRLASTTIDMQLHTVQRLAVQIANITAKRMKDWSHPDDFRHMFVRNDPADTLGRLVLPRVHTTWSEDDEFARQFMSGTNPMSIVHVSEHNPIPAVLNLTNSVVRQLNSQVLAGRASFELLLLQGKLFFNDYDILADVHSHLDRVFYAPIVLLYLGNDSLLHPLLIQLTRYNHTWNEVYMPGT
eukprot:TRINITY_DN2375_c0_g1_i2.p1 TRINITY_DN2375_c0_g1~~TRINITY_DN2375_c0_g1_i2.p1  ORF type:complete len:1180 (+),score=397.38 TRINITY_DN2375_c0_g1_i2:284-3823(+)